jgi:hypothetical protein
MSTIVKNAVDSLSAKFPNWQDLILVYLRNDKDIEDKKLLDAFWSFISSLCDSIRSNECSIDDVVKNLNTELQIEIQDLLKNRLRPYFACAFIRKFETDKKSQLEFLIDEIWQQNVIRRNPGYIVDPRMNAKLDISDSDIREFILTLNAIVDHCISRLLNYDGTVSVIKLQTGISEDLSEYIARKIDKDNDALRINYLIKRMTSI